MVRPGALLLAALISLAGLLPASAADTAPFFRLGDPLFFDIGPEARQFTIKPPMGATSYRMVNPCRVDIRIRKVSSLDEKVTLRSGTRFLARTAEVVATSRPSFVSLITHGDPGSQGCTVELQYGTGY